MVLNTILWKPITGKQLTRGFLSVNNLVLLLEFHVHHILAGGQKSNNGNSSILQQLQDRSSQVSEKSISPVVIS